MQGCICKNEGEEILLVGRKTSGRVGIRRGGFRVAHTHVHTDARIRTVNEEDVFLFATRLWLNFKILLKNPFLLPFLFFFFFSSYFFSLASYRMQTIRQPMETRKYCPLPSLHSSQSVSKITLPPRSKNVSLPSL